MGERGDGGGGRGRRNVASISCVLGRRHHLLLIGRQVRTASHIAMPVVDVAALSP
jgi:hypothetical protein